jgi:hypothetical protein
MKELTEKEKGITVETRELLVSLDEKQKELVEHQTNLVNMKNMYRTYKYISTFCFCLYHVRIIKKDSCRHDF